MPESGANTTVEASRRGDRAFIQFTAEENLAEDAEWMPVTVRVEYVDGWAVCGMPYACSMRMLIQEFRTLVPGWRILPNPCYRRDFRGCVIPESQTAWTPEEDFSDNDTILCLPSRIQEDAARVTFYLNHHPTRIIIGIIP
jgi:hypothetical protein